MVYDAIIIGGGPSGATTAICMQNAGKKCLILEKKMRIEEKTCGGFLSSGGLRALQSIGLNVKELLEIGAVPIHNFKYIKNGKSHINPYASNEYGLGLTRNLFDNWLLDHAIKAGAEVRFGVYVKSIARKDDIFQVNDYLSSNVIIASGANSLVCQEIRTVLSNQTFGLSAQITGITSLSTDNVYFYITGDNGLDYFWIIPNGNNIWNIGMYALDNYGTLLLNGEGVKQNPVLAFSMLKKSADMGYSEAMFHVGVCFFEGWGTQRNMDEALRYLTAAYNAGIEEATTYLQKGFNEKNGTWVKRRPFMFSKLPDPEPLPTSKKIPICRGGCIDICAYANMVKAEEISDSDEFCYCELMKQKVFQKSKCPYYKDMFSSFNREK